MTTARVLSPLLLALAFAGAAALAQPATTTAPASTYEPTVGQKGKDVVWVPTPQPLVDKMLDMAKATPKDYLMDLGSGDGRLIITAAKRGIPALGIEYDPDMVELSKRKAQEAGVGDRAQFVKADIFETDFSKATVITMFLLPDLNLRLRPTILKLKPGTRIVSNSFTMGDWEADETFTLDSAGGCESSWCTALLWIVPAQVEGTHKVAQGELTLKQIYQTVSGTLKTDGKVIPVEGKLRGEEITLTGGGRTWRGKVEGKRVVLS